MRSEYDSKLFEGTAQYYAQYRFPYEKELLAFILNTALSGASSKALDLGCGTGQLAIPLSNHFEEIVCMDPDPEMLAELKRIADEKKSSTWKCCRHHRGILARLHQRLFNW